MLKYRNEISHHKVKQKERLRKWYDKEKRKGERSEYMQIRLYVQKCRIDMERCSCDTLKRWIMNLKKIEKKVEKIPYNDIRRYMIV